MRKLYGITTAMVTPFKENGSVDFVAIEQLTEFLILKGVDCLYPCGTTGEMLRISTEDRKMIAETIIRTANGRLPVFIHCGAMCEEETIALMKHAEKSGADGVGVVTPQFFSMSPREMEEFYVRVAGSVASDYPVYLYNIPQCSANDITAAVAQRISNRAKNIVGIKYSFADINRTLDYLEINDGAFSVMHGCDRSFVAFCALGCDGTVSGISGVFPEPFVEVYRACRNNDWETARKWQHIGARITDILKGGNNMSYFKEALKMRGIDGGHMKKPLLDITAEEIEGLKSEIKAFCVDSGITLEV